MIANTWHVTLRRYLKDETMAILAHAEYRRETADAMKRINAQTEVETDPAGRNPAFIRIGS